MLTHVVFFWAKEGLSVADLADFEQGLRTLPAIPGVVDGSVGVPGPPARPVVDRSYAFALLLRFQDLAAHDAYQIHPIHRAFHERCVKYWSRVAVYDFVAPPFSP